jgi:hypothetical protein
MQNICSSYDAKTCTPQHFEGNHIVSSSKSNKNPKLRAVVTGNLVSEAKVPKQYNFSMRCDHHGILEMLSQLRTKYYTCVENMYCSNTSLHLFDKKVIVGQNSLDSKLRTLSKETLP